jgi:NAD(P)-dependent dehydrogenase (short-subunit alcohol dehydrogenase family)
VDVGLKDATAVVAGGARGMGLAAARGLADDGARVAIAGRTKDVLENAAEDRPTGEVPMPSESLPIPGTPQPSNMCSTAVAISRSPNI